MSTLKKDVQTGRLLIIDVDNPPDITAEEFLQYIHEGFVPFTKTEFDAAPEDVDLAQATHVINWDPVSLSFDSATGSVHISLSDGGPLTFLSENNTNSTSTEPSESSEPSSPSDGGSGSSPS